MVALQSVFAPIEPGTNAIIAPNAPSRITERLLSGKVSRTLPWLALPLRTLLFALTQAFCAALALLNGSKQPWVDAAFWWPLYVILPNLITLAALVRMTRSEGIRITDLYNFDRSRLGKDVLAGLALILLGLPVGGLGFIGASYLLYGGTIPEYVTALPMWAAWISLLVMPLSIAAVELPLYLGYIQPRLQLLTGKTAAPLLLVAFWLAAQHCTLPLLFDVRFILYRFMMMVPVAIFVGLVYQRTHRLFPLMLLHVLLDLQLGITVFVMSAA